MWKRFWLEQFELLSRPIIASWCSVSITTKDPPPKEPPRVSVPRWRNTTQDVIQSLDIRHCCFIAKVLAFTARRRFSSAFISVSMWPFYQNNSSQVHNVEKIFANRGPICRSNTECKPWKFYFAKLHGHKRPRHSHRRNRIRSYLYAAQITGTNVAVAFYAVSSSWCRIGLMVFIVSTWLRYWPLLSGDRKVTWPNAFMRKVVHTFASEVTPVMDCKVAEYDKAKISKLWKKIRNQIGFSSNY